MVDTITRTVSLSSYIDEMEDELDSIENRRDDIRNRAENFEPDNIPNDLTSEWEEVEEERVRIEGRISRIETIIEDLDDDTFVLKELTYGEMQDITDEVMDMSFDVDVQRERVDGTPKQGAMRSMTLQRAIVDAPEGMPDNPADYPSLVSEWLYEKVDALNSVGDTNLETSSLADEIS